MLKLGKLTVQWRHYNPDVIRQINQFRLNNILSDYYFVPDQQHIVFKDNNNAYYGTDCIIHVPQEDELPPLEIIGRAGLHKTYRLNKKSQCWEWLYEAFSKEIGRKISLENALKQLTLTKDERQQIWNDYNNRKK